MRRFPACRVRLPAGVGARRYGTCERCRDASTESASVRLGLIAGSCWVGVHGRSTGRCAAALGGVSSPWRRRPPSPAPTPDAACAGTACPGNADQPAAGYAGSDTCVVCHTAGGQPQGARKHGQAKNPRSPAATTGCESCHGPGRRTSTTTPRGTSEVRRDEAGGGQPDLSDLPQPRHPRRVGGQHARGAQPLLHDLPQRPQARNRRSTSW